MCGPYVSNCVGGAEGSGEDVIFGQEGDMEAEEGSILAMECEKRWIQEGPFNTGRRCLASITNSTDVNFDKLREAWCAAVCWVARIRQDLVTEQFE